nr:uncharacterized protein CI109_005009 [Kwoniella shandongensis]KAA5526619.1 hypothetical protein CI109_005009 [Kwoniella shandongensis]
MSTEEEEHINEPAARGQEPIQIVQSEKLKGSVAATLPAEVIQCICVQLTLIIPAGTLPPLPLESNKRYWVGEVNNDRLSHEEIATCKRFLVRQALYDISRVCKHWWNAVKALKMGDEVIIIGNRDMRRATKNPSSWFTLSPGRSFSLTVTSEIFHLMKLLEALSAHSRPINIRKFTLLHNHAPSEDNDYGSNLDHAFGLVAPEEVHIGFYSGGMILDQRTLDEIATTLRKSHSRNGGSRTWRKPLNPKGTIKSVHPWWRDRTTWGSRLFGRMLRSWQGTTKRLTIRANDILDPPPELKAAITSGVLRHFDYHIEPGPDTGDIYLALGIPRWSSYLREASEVIYPVVTWDLQAPLGSTRSHEVHEHTAKDDHEIGPLEWTIYIRSEEWLAHKGSYHIGTPRPWEGSTEDMCEAIADFILDETEHWAGPYNAPTMSNKQLLDEMIFQVLGRPSRRRKGSLQSFLRKVGLRSGPSKESVEPNQAIIRTLQTLETMKEELYINGEVRNEMIWDDLREQYVRMWVRERSDEQREAIIGRLEEVFKARHLYARMNWPIRNESMSGVRIVAEPTKIL